MRQRIHYFQHVSFEGLGCIQKWIDSKNHITSRTAFHQNENLPNLQDIDWLIIMGGPMNIYEDQKYPWLVEEKRFIRLAIEQGKKVLGICLGAQLIADALGAKVISNHQKEIGWHIIDETPERKKSKCFSRFPESLITFHWHGDTFQIPKGAKHVLSSEACAHQAFEYQNKVIGLQFHLECFKENIEDLLIQAADDLKPGPYVQSTKEILSKMNYLPINHLVLYQLLDQLESAT